jgi:chromosome partitioning protein
MPTSPMAAAQQSTPPAPAPVATPAPAPQPQVQPPQAETTHAPTPAPVQQPPAQHQAPAQTHSFIPQQQDPYGPRFVTNEQQKRCRVICLSNQKGGVAKTTTTMNLGAALSELGNKVLVVDLDPQSNLTMSFGIDVESLPKSIFDVLVHKYPIEHVIQSTPECDVAVASIDLAGAELALSSMIGRERTLEKALASVKNDYDYILIDTPPSLGLLTVNAFTASDEVIVPVQAEYLSLRGLVQLDNTLQVIREHLNPRVHIGGVLMTMYDGRTIHSREATELLEKTYGDRVMKTRIRKTIRLAEAPVQGSSVLTYESNGKAAAQYRELAQEVVARVEQAV